jgi:long-chain acyl-CoA synthetase
MTTLVFNGGLQTLADSRRDTPCPGIPDIVSTLADLPFHVLEHFPGTVLLRRAAGASLVELTGAQVFERVRQLTLGLSQLGIGRGDRVGIISDSRPEWVVADLASLAAGAVTVPVYPTQSAGQVEFILRDCRAKAVIVSGIAQLEKVRRVRGRLADLELLLGLTETSPVLTANGPGNARPGTVGRPLAGVRIRVADDGEILAQGPNVMTGYHCRPDLNEVSLSGGWFHTGDTGTLDQDGFLTITGRKKDLIVTAGGKKVAPAPLEAFLRRDPLVADAVLVGENRKFISALIVPDFARLDAQLRAMGPPSGRPDELVRRADVLHLYQDLVDGLNAGLAQFERIKRLALVPTTETLSRAPGGDTMLARRAAFELRWKSIVDRVYVTGAKDGRD